MCMPGSSPARYSNRASARYRISLTSVDLPEPLTPVTVVSTPSGIVTSMFLRLLARAPLTTRSAALRDGGSRRLDRPLAAEIRARQRAVSVLEQRRRGALEDDVATVFTRHPAPDR